MAATHVTIYRSDKTVQTDLRSFIDRVYDKSLQFIVHRWQLQFLFLKSLSIKFAQFYRRVWMAIAQLPQFAPELHGARFVLCAADRSAK